MEKAEFWNNMVHTPWNVMKHNPIKYGDFLSLEYLRKKSQVDVEKFLWSSCSWLRAGGIPKQLVSICVEKLSIDPIRAKNLYPVNRSAVLQSYFHTVFPISSPLAAVSARFINAKEALVYGIEASESIELLPVALCEEFVSAVEEHIQTFGASPDDTTQAFIVEKALFIYADVLRALGELTPEEIEGVKQTRREKFELVENLLTAGGKTAEMEYIKQLF
jgi:hypothetical protein